MKVGNRRKGSSFIGYFHCKSFTCKVSSSHPCHPWPRSTQLPGRQPGQFMMKFEAKATEVRRQTRLLERWMLTSTVDSIFTFVTANLVGDDSDGRRGFKFRNSLQKEECVTLIVNAWPHSSKVIEMFFYKRILCSKL